MKKTLAVLLFVLIAFPCFSADFKISDKTNIAKGSMSSAYELLLDNGTSYNALTLAVLLDWLDDQTWTFASGFTVATGQHITVGTTQWDNGSDKIDGEQIADDTIDDDSIDLSDVTLADFATGSGTAGNVLLDDGDGTFSFSNSINLSFSGADPEVLFRDTNAAGADDADEDAGSIKAQMTTTTEDGEISDMRLTAFGAATAGTEYTWLWLDASADTVYLGTMEDDDTPAEIADLALVVNGTISGKVKVATDADGKTLTKLECKGSMQMATGAGTWNLPDIDAADGTGWTVCVYSTGANDVNVNPDDEDKIRAAGTVLAAGAEIDQVTAAAGDYVCLMVTDFDSDIAIWTTLGMSGTWN